MKVFAHRKGIIFESDSEGIFDPKLVEISNFDFPIFSNDNLIKRMQQRSAAGHKCYGYFVNHNLISYFWVSNNCLAPFSFGLNINVPKNTYYIWGCKTDTSHQQKGYYTRGLQSLLAMARKLNKKPLIMCEFDNEPSIRGIISAGFNYKQTFRVVKIWQLFFLWRDSRLTVNTLKINL